jgi:hypothetical protein
VSQMPRRRLGCLTRPIASVRPGHTVISRIMAAMALLAIVPAGASVLAGVIALVKRESATLTPLGVMRSLPILMAGLCGSCRLL